MRKILSLQKLYETDIPKSNKNQSNVSIGCLGRSNISLFIC
ncbi:class III lanthipeptide [Bacillus safensis]|nr:class III lanthipeptide [Bacillus safensis]